MPQAIGIDISTHAIRAVTMTGSGQNPVIKDFYREEIPQNQDGHRDFAPALENILNRISAKDNIIVSVPAYHIMLRNVTLPFRDTRKIEKTLKFELEKHLPLPVEEIIADYYLTNPTDQDKAKLITLACKKELIKSILEVFQKKGVEPVRIESDIFALLNTFSWHQPDATEPCVLLDSGAGTIKVLALRDGMVVFSRIIRLPDQYSNLTDGQPSESSQDALERMILEIKKSLSSLPHAREIKKIYISGPWSSAPSLLTDRAGDLGAPVEAFDPVGNIPTGPGAGDPELKTEGAAAIGLALSGLGHRAHQINLRKEEFVFQGSLERIKTPLLTCALLMLATTTLLLFYLIMVGGQKKKIIDRIQSAQRQTIQKIFPEKKEADINRLLSRSDHEIKSIFGKKIKDLQGGIGSNTKVKLKSTLDIWNEVMKLVPRRIQWKMTNLRITQQNMTLTMVVGSRTDADNIRKAIDNSPTFTARFSGNVTKRTKDNKFTAPLRITYQ